MAQDLKVGQFWLDTVNKDLLRIEGFSFDVDPDGTDRAIEFGLGRVPGTEYSRCRCYVHGYYFGIQEMKSSHFQNAARFKRISRLAAYWLLARARLRALRNC